VAEDRRSGPGGGRSAAEEEGRSGARPRDLTAYVAPMALHPQIATMLDLMAQAGLPGLDQMTLEQARAGMSMTDPNAVPEAVHEIRDLDAGGIPARLYHPSPDVTGLLVYFHGGGWVIGDLDTHDGTCRSLANHSGHAVLSIEYRLAPEHKYPAAVDDCEAATKWAYDNAASLRADPERLAVGGDSAGGNLAAIIATAGIVPLRFELLVYPVTDLRAGHASHTENAEGYFLTSSAMEWFATHYLGDSVGTIEDPKVSPLLASDDVLRTAPPGLVITAQYDPLRDEGEAYASRLNQLGVATSAVRFGGQIHGFFSIPGILDGATARELAGAALRDALA